MAMSCAIDPAYWPEAIRDHWYFYVEGIGLVRADDTGSKVKGRNRMDIAVGTKQAAFDITGYRRVWLVGPRQWGKEVNSDAA